MKRWLLLMILLTTPVWAAEECVTVDTATWTQAQKNRLPALAGSLAGVQGDTRIPTRYTESLICWDDPTFDVPTVITTQTILDRYAMEEAVRQSAETAEATRQVAFESEVMTNDLCTASLAEIESRIDTEVAALQTQLDATTTAAEVKAHLRNQLYPKLGAVFKKIARCLKARAGR